MGNMEYIFNNVSMTMKFHILKVHEGLGQHAKEMSYIHISTLSYSYHPILLKAKHLPLEKVVWQNLRIMAIGAGFCFFWGTFPVALYIYTYKTLILSVCGFVFVFTFSWATKSLNFMTFWLKASFGLKT